MRIVHIGHGRIPIPPTASGAVEAIISDYQFWCERYGHEFFVVNEPDPIKSMLEVARLDADVVHIHDESKIDAFTDSPVTGIIIVTTHDPTFFNKPNPFLKRFVEGDFYVGCLSGEQAHAFMSYGVPLSRCIPCTNGARSDLIRFRDKAALPGRFICLGMIGKRKRQEKLLAFDFVDLVGPASVYDPISATFRKFISWDKNDVYQNFTTYEALVLLSEFEAAPLVVMEALMAGLDVVVSESAAANLDRRQPFIHVLSENTINNPVLLEMALKKVLNRTKDRAAVRKYAEEHHCWKGLAKSYLEQIVTLTKDKSHGSIRR